MEHNYMQEVTEQFNLLANFTQKILLLVCRLCSTSGIKVRSFFEVIESSFEEMPYCIQGEFDGLLLGGWIAICGDEIKSITEVSEAIDDIDMIDDLMRDIMERLAVRSTVNPHDDLLERVSDIRMGYNLLLYYYTRDRLGFDQEADLFGKLAVNVARNIGIAEGLGGVRDLYELKIYKILEYGRAHVKYGSNIYAQISLALASIHNQVFEYEGCKKYIDEANIVAIHEGITDTQVEVFLAKTEMLENQSLLGEALFYSKMAYDLNILLHGDNCQENNQVVLIICRICLYLRDQETCKKWFEKLNGKYSRFSELNIKRLLIEGDMYDSSDLSIHFFDEAAYLSFQVFGFVQPYIYNWRSTCFDIRGLYDKGAKEYGRYMRSLRTLYGLTTNGDLVVYYASRVFSCLANGEHQMAAQFNSLAIDLCPADGPQFSFGARSYQYLSIASTYCYATHESLAEAYATAVLEQINKHLNIPSEMINKIEEVFGPGKMIPSQVFGIDLIKYAYRIKIDVALYEGQLEYAEQLCNECLDVIRGTEEECWILSSLGYVKAKCGKDDTAIEIWENAIELSGINTTDIKAEIASFASDVGLLEYALDIINDVSNCPTSGSYQSWLIFSNICETAGLVEKRDELFQIAQKLSVDRGQKCRCYYQQGLASQDRKAIELLEKSLAIDADSGLSVDEELAYRWKALSENRASLGLYNEAREAAINAERFFPGERECLFGDTDDF